MKSKLILNNEKSSLVFVTFFIDDTLRKSNFIKI